MYYTASGIITPVGGRLVHRLRADWLECMGLWIRRQLGFIYTYIYIYIHTYIHKHTEGAKKCIHIIHRYLLKCLYILWHPLCVCVYMYVYVCVYIYNPTDA